MFEDKDGDVRADAQGKREDRDGAEPCTRRVPQLGESGDFALFRF